MAGPGLVLKHITQSSGGPRISRIARITMLGEKKAFAAHLDRLAETPALARIVVAHHETIEDDPRGALRTVATSLRRNDVGRRRVPLLKTAVRPIRRRA